MTSCLLWTASLAVKHINLLNGVFADTNLPCLHA